MVLSGSGRSPPPATNRRIRLSHGTNATHSSNNTRGTTDEDDNGSAFFAALSPSTARFLKDGNAAGEQRERILGNNIKPSNSQETNQLRSFVHSLLGNNNSSNLQFTTPDPHTATYYALQLYTLTNRIDDAYLAARALALSNEEKRAVWILEGAGLVGCRGEQGDAAAGTDIDNLPASGDSVTDLERRVSNAQGIQNALCLRIESALLAGQCLSKIGEVERALTVYSEAMRFPPVPPKREWGLYGYGYVLDENANDPVDGEDVGMNEIYVRQWREQSLLNSALIDEGDDLRLLRLAEHVCSLPFAGDNNDSNERTNNNSILGHGTHPLARLCTARGIAYDSISSPHRALPFLKAALLFDVRCIEAWDYVIMRKLLTPSEEREWYDLLNWNDTALKGMGWLKDAYLVRLRGGDASQTLPPSTVQMTGEAIDESRIMDASTTHHGVGLQTPAFSLGSPDFKDDKAKQQNKDTEDSIDQAFCNLAITHQLGKSSDVLALAAIRSYTSHNLQAALTYCTVIDTLDPFCRTSGYVYVATLVGLGLKRRLFQLAHRLVDADPKDALAWFAVGSYYYICGRHDLSQRHFSRSTRLDPSSAESWIGFGCSFAICDESDQALASFRAAQNKYSGSHIPLLYMGMEYLRTNHLSLAGHFLASSQKTDPSDPLCCNELGVWAFRRGDLEDAVFWFVKALRLHIRTNASSLTCTDEALGANGYILLNNTDNEVSDGSKHAETSFAQGNNTKLPSTVLCTIKTPSGQTIAAHKSSNATADAMLTDLQCVDRCNDMFWEPTIYNLGQSYRKLQRFADAIACFEKCSSFNPGNSTASSALGFARHLSGDIDGAIDSYHEALSHKPDDPFSTEMLNRALAEAITYPKSSVFESDMFKQEIMRQSSVIGVNILPTSNRNKGDMGMAG